MHIYGALALFMLKMYHKLKNEFANYKITRKKMTNVTKKSREKEHTD